MSVDYVPLYEHLLDFQRQNGLSVHLEQKVALWGCACLSPPPPMLALVLRDSIRGHPFKEVA